MLIPAINDGLRLGARGGNLPPGIFGNVEAPRPHAHGDQSGASVQQQAWRGAYFLVLSLRRLHVVAWWETRLHLNGTTCSGVPFDVTQTVAVSLHGMGSRYGSPAPSVTARLISSSIGAVAISFQPADCEYW
jgi:hypothetical protein